MSEIPSVDDVQKLLSRGPFHQWLGLKVIAVGSGTIELTATWREEWVANPDRGYTHGGTLAQMGHGFQDRARGSHHRFARGLSSRCDARCIDGPRRDREFRAPVLGRRSQGL